MIQRLAGAGDNRGPRNSVDRRACADSPTRLLHPGYREMTGRGQAPAMLFPAGYPGRRNQAAEGKTAAPPQ